MTETGVDHIAGTTFHGRKGTVQNRFRYTVDYVLLTPDSAKGPGLFSRNRANLAAVAGAVREICRRNRTG